MKNMTQIFRQYCVYLQAIAQGNVIDLKRVDNQNCSH